MAHKSKAACHAEKLSGTWCSGIIAIYRLGTFDLLVFRVILGSFSALVSKFPLTRTRLMKRSEIRDGGVVSHILGSFIS